MKKLTAILLALMLTLSLFSFAAAEGSYKIGICNLVDDASLNQIIQNLKDQLAVIAAETGATFEVAEQNCNLDFGLLDQIIANYITDGVDLMVGVTTPVAQAMQGATEEAPIPVIFAAVSDPVGAGLVESLEAPGANITGTSDFLDTKAVFNLIFTADPEADLIALLYNSAEDASATPIADAKALLDARGVKYKEYGGSTVSEVMSAVEALISDEADAVFTPTDNTIMTAELSIYEALAEAGIPHYTGADSFALNGAFLGYGVDYANLGRETANMVAAVLLEGADPAALPVMRFDNGIATVNTETCEALGLNYVDVAALFAPFCTTVQPIATADSFDDLK